MDRHADPDTVHDAVAELFALLATPIRLKIIAVLSGGEKNVTQLLGLIATTQPNMSQHLSTLYRAGILGRRRNSTQIYYRLESQRVATLCRAVSQQMATELDPAVQVDPSDRLRPLGAR
jgi:DNA-binding transcriptional ArsR family regulator